MEEDSIQSAIHNINSHLGKNLQKPQFTPIRDKNLPTFT